MLDNSLIEQSLVASDLDLPNQLIRTDVSVRAPAANSPVQVGHMRHSFVSEQRLDNLSLNVRSRGAYIEVDGRVYDGFLDVFLRGKGSKPETHCGSDCGKGKSQGGQELTVLAKMTSDLAPHLK